MAYERRNRDLDPQLVWRQDEHDWSDLVVHAPPLYIQEKVHPKVLIDDLLRQSAATKSAGVKRCWSWQPAAARSGHQLASAVADPFDHPDASAASA